MSEPHFNIGDRVRFNKHTGTILNYHHAYDKRTRFNIQWDDVTHEGRGYCPLAAELTYLFKPGDIVMCSWTSGDVSSLGTYIGDDSPGIAIVHWHNTRGHVLHTHSFLRPYIKPHIGVIVNQPVVRKGQIWRDDASKAKGKIDDIVTSTFGNQSAMFNDKHGDRIAIPLGPNGSPLYASWKRVGRKKLSLSAHALLMIEWSGFDVSMNQRYSGPACPGCKAWLKVKIHEFGCIVDAVLTKEGLDTQEKRDAARKRLGI